MSQKPNPLSASEPWNLVADGYAETTMQVFTQYAEEAIAACGLKRGAVVLDVACGPGTMARCRCRACCRRRSAFRSVRSSAVASDPAPAPHFSSCVFQEWGNAQTNLSGESILSNMARTPQPYRE